MVQIYEAIVCTTETFTLGECCRWDEERAELCWIDVPSGRFFRARADGTQIDILNQYDVGPYLTAIAPLENRSDGWIVATNQSLSLLTESGEITEIARPEGHNAPDVRTNDGSADPWGYFWIGSMAFNAELGRGSLYRYHEISGVERRASGITISNGIGWSKDRQSMYYVDSGPGTIHKFDVDDCGDIHNQRTFIQFDVERDGTPDGLCIDENDAIWVAMWGGYEVRQLSPDGGTISRVKLPTAQPSCCTIGGEHGTTLYVTTAREDLSEEILESEPDAGRLFCAEVGVRGLPLNPYRRTPRRMI